MTQYRFWKQLAESTQNWKVKLVAWNHMERIEKAPTADTVSA